jgi:hypothetical protein
MAKVTFVFPTIDISMTAQLQNDQYTFDPDNVAAR